jgi:hypothetical protein
MAAGWFIMAGRGVSSPDDSSMAFKKKILAVGTILGVALP